MFILLLIIIIKIKFIDINICIIKNLIILFNNFTILMIIKKLNISMKIHIKIQLLELIIKFIISNKFIFIK